MIMDINDIRKSLQELKGRHADMSPVSLRDKALMAYNHRMLDKLESVLNKHMNNVDLAEAFQELLTKNWELINDSALCYTALPTHDITLLLCDVAQFVANEKKLNPIEVLIPGLTVESCRDAYPDLDANANIKSLLQTHILGNKGAYLLPIRLITELDLSENAIKLGNPYFDAFKPVGNGLVDAAEYKRLGAHSMLTQAVYATRQEYKTLSSDTSNLLGQLTQLCKQLAINSASGVGEETNAASGAYPAIIAFMNYYTSLVPCGFQVMQKPPEVGDLPTDRNIAYVLAQLDSEPDHAELYFINRLDEDTPVKKVSLEGLKFGLSLMIVPDEAHIPSLDKQNPTLIQIQNTNQYRLYGAAPDQTWGFTELDATVMSTLFLKNCAPLSECPLGNVPDAIYNEIANKKAHTQTLSMCMNDLHISESVSTCSLMQLAAITDMTGHNFLAEKSIVPPVLQSEINLLFDLARNPTKNIDATKTISTCINTRKENISASMGGHATLLSGISLSGARKQSLIEEAQQHFDIARTELNHALNTNTYTEGHDKLNLNIRLIKTLNIQLNMTSLSDLDIIKSLTPDEIISVCAEPALRKQIITQLKTLENLVIFIMDIPPEKLTAFLQANRQELLEAFINSSNNLAALLISLNVEKCKAIVEILNLDIIKSGSDFRDVMYVLTPEQRTIVFDAMKDRWSDFIKTSEDFYNVMRYSSPEQRAIIFDIMKDKWPDIIKSGEDLVMAVLLLTLEQRKHLFQIIQEKLPDFLESDVNLCSFLMYIVMDARRGSEMSDIFPFIIKSGKHLGELLQTIQSRNVIVAKSMAVIKLIHTWRWNSRTNDDMGYARQHMDLIMNIIKDELPNIIHSGKDFCDVLKDLYPSLRTAVFKILNEKLPEMAKSSQFFYDVVSGLLPTERMDAIAVMKNKFPDIIRSGHDLYMVLWPLSPEERTVVYDIMKDKLPALIQSGNDFGVMLTFVSSDQRKTLISIKRLIDSFENTAPEANIRELASALISDNNVRIKAEFEHLVESSLSPAELILALSYVEPLWLEKINKAVGLQLTPLQLTDQPHFATVIKQYMALLKDNKKTVIDQYKRAIRPLTVEHEKQRDKDAVRPPRPSDYKKIAEKRRIKDGASLGGPKNSRPKN